MDFQNPLFGSICAFIFFISSPLCAADWASTTTSSMNTAGNWSPSGVPAPVTDLNFLSAPTQKTVDNDISNGYETGIFTINSSSSYTFQSTSNFLLNIGGTFTISNSTSHTFAGPVAFNGSMHLGGGTLTISGDLNGSFLPVVTGSGVILLNYPNPSFSGNLTGTTTTTFRAGVANAFTENFQITSGNVDFNSFSQTVGPITIGSANTLSTGNGNTITFNVGGTFDGTISGSATFVVADFESLSFRGSNPSFSGNYILGAISSLRLSGSALAPSFGTGTVTLTVASSFVQLATANSVTVPNNILGSGYVEVSTLAGNTITLSGTNTFSGGITIFSGNLSVASTASLGSGSIFFDGLNAKLTVSSPSTQTLSQALAHTIGGQGTFEVNGGGKLILDNTATAFSGATTVALSTTLQLHNSVSSFGNVTNNGSFIFDTDATSSFGGLSSVISGSGAITKQNTAAMTLNGVNTYGGSTTINGGALIMGVSGAIPDGTSLQLANTSGALLNLNNFNLSVISLEGGGSSGGNISLGSATLTVTNSAPNSYGGAISGSGGLTLNSSSTLSLSGANTYSGTTTISAGTLELTTGVSLNSSGISNSSALSLSPASGSITVPAVSGTGPVTKSGAGIAVIGQVSSYSGATTISAGTLRMGLTNALTGTASVSLADTAGAILDLNSNNLTIKNLSGGGSTGGNVTLGSGTLTINSLSPTTYGGVISGSGGIIKTGSETFTLSNLSTYSGSTQITGGNLSIAVANALPSATRLILANTAGVTLDLNDLPLAVSGISGGGTTGGTIALGFGTLTVDMSDTDLTYGGTFTSTGPFGGRITKTGSNTLTLTQQSPDLFGLIQIMEGTISLQDIGALGSGIVFNSGTLSFDDPTNGSFLNTISGSGGLIKNATSTLTLSGNNSYAGTTVLNAGTLAFASSSALSQNTSFILSTTQPVVLNFTDIDAVIRNLSAGGVNSSVLLGSGSLTLGSGGDATFNGIISGTGGRLIKVEGDTLTLTANNTYTGNTQVQAGTLVVNGSIAGPIQVDLDGRLKGTGVIGGVATINGTVQPGNSIGTLHFDNSITLGSTSETVIEINDSQATSVLEVVGDVTIQNGAQVRFINAPGSYETGMQFPFLTYTGTLTGLNNWTLFPPSLLFACNLIQADQVVYLVLGEQISFFIPLTNLSGNQLATAKYLNEVGNYQLGNPFTILSQLPENELANALNTISPARNSFADFILCNTVFSLNQALDQRYTDRRLMVRAEEGAAKVAAAKETAHLEEGLIAAVDFAGMENKKPRRSSPLSVWGSTIGNWNRMDSQLQNPAFHDTTAGVIIGADYAWQRLLLGGALAYARSIFQERHQFGSGTTSSGYGTLYLETLGSAFYFDAAFWLGDAWTKNQRRIFYPGFSSKAKSSFHTQQREVHVGFGYDFLFSRPQRTILLEPFASLDAVFNTEQGYKERGGGVYNVESEGRFTSMLRSEVGILNAYTWAFNHGTLSMKARASYVNKAPFNVGRVSTSIVGAAGSFTVESFTAVENLFSPVVELLWKSEKGLSLSCQYLGEFGSGYIANQGTVHIGQAF